MYVIGPKKVDKYGKATKINKHLNFLFPHYCSHEYDDASIENHHLEYPTNNFQERKKRKRK